MFRYQHVAWLALAGLLATACGPRDTAAVHCTFGSECPAGMICSPEGLCVAPSDGGDTVPDGGAGCHDNDMDGFDGYNATCHEGLDCDDTSSAANPSMDEVCGDGIDNNCDGEVDEEACLCSRGVTRECYSGDPAQLNVGICHGGVQICDSDGAFGDCLGEQLPLAMELCGNMVDDDCDGEIDEDCDCDPNCHCDDPGAGVNCECNPPTNQPCYSGPASTGNQGPCHGGARSCIDQGGGVWAWTACAGEVVPAPEVCGDGIDNDCDGTVDDGCGTAPDEDGDGYSVAAGDCDDQDASRFPTAQELCNGLDDNCNGEVDEGCPCAPNDGQSCYTGPSAAAGVLPCVQGWQWCEGTGEFTHWGECLGEVLPGVEVCDGVDNDCDGEIDERWAVGSNGCGYCVSDEIVCDGADDDCDGLIDEGLVNSCGLCPPNPCYTETYDDPGTCTVAGRECDGTGPWEGDPTAVTLTQSEAQTPFIYISVTNKHEVAQLDTNTGVKNWQKPTYGMYPSRTAVAADYSVWVGNRAHTGGADPNNLAHSNAVHLDTNGDLICRADIPGIARGLAIDGEGNVWVGAYNTGIIYKVSGTQFDASQTPPRCTILASQAIGVNIYGLAVDGSGYVWTGSVPTVRVNTQNITNFVSYTHTGSYGIAVDYDDNIWFGNLGGAVHRLNASAAYVQDVTSPVTVVGGVAVDLNGDIWGSRYSNNQVVKINPVTGAQECIATTSCGSYTGACSNPHGVAALMDGTVWVPMLTGGYVSVHDGATCAWLRSYPVDPGQMLYTYSDMAGVALMTITTKQGTWKQNFDSGYDSPYWTALHWNVVQLPLDTTVEATVRTADTEAELTSAPSADCGPFSSVLGPNTADLSTCPGIHDNRWLQADILLRTTRNDSRPVVNAVSVDWSYIP